ncbi:unnamed protein product [Ceratitis capitata]|uniref:(Mediterranean fruit fly) hypothetical protein n=1 Tax=Ceratitis capitata TaxID=7213 RepID=A0A811UTQ0_CERCA|nr:unnamed protein product [Ceratitis capitata]
MSRLWKSHMNAVDVAGYLLAATKEEAAELHLDGSRGKASGFMCETPALSTAIRGTVPVVDHGYCFESVQTKECRGIRREMVKEFYLRAPSIGGKCIKIICRALQCY